MKAIIRHEGEEIGSVQTNHSMSLEEAMQLAGLDINEMEGCDPKYDLGALELRWEREEEPPQTKTPRNSIAGENISH